MIYIYIFVSFCFSACLICLRIPMLGRACLVLHICAHTQFIIPKSPTFKKNIWHILMNCAHFLLIVLNLYIENWPMKRVAIHSHLMDDLKLGWKHPATFFFNRRMKTSDYDSTQRGQKSEEAANAARETDL